MAGAYKTGKYRNIFKEYGYPEEEIQNGLTIVVIGGLIRK